MGNQQSRNDKITDSVETVKVAKDNCKYAEEVEEQEKFEDTVKEEDISTKKDGKQEQVEKNTERDRFIPEPFEVMVRLRPTSKHSECYNTREKKVMLKTRPLTGLDFKKAIENDLQIPVCLQTLTCHSHPILDDQYMPSLYLQADDVITVEYTTEADVDEMRRILKELQHIAELLETSKPYFPKLFPRALLLLPHTRYPASDLLNAVTQDTDKAIADRVYLVHNNGLALILDLLRLITSIPWACLRDSLKYMEMSLLQVLVQISSTLGFQRLLMQQLDLVDVLGKSILRQDIFPHQMVQLRCGQHEEATMEDTLLAEIIYYAIGVIVNLAELPPFRLKIAEQSKIIDQMTAAILSPSYSMDLVLPVMITFALLSFTPQAHQYLVSPLILGRILEACKKFSSEQYSSEETYVILMRYFAALLFSLISTNSDICLGREFEGFSTDILSFVHKFLQDYTYEQVKRAEEEIDYIWLTLTPIVNLVYAKHKDISAMKLKDKPIEKQLYLMSIKMGLLNLKVSCTSESTVGVLEKEGQIDFLVCLPWYITDELKEEACAVVRLLSIKRKLGPPTLVNIAKARLGSWCMPLVDLASPLFLENIHALMNRMEI